MHHSWWEQKNPEDGDPFLSNGLLGTRRTARLACHEALDFFMLGGASSMQSSGSMACGSQSQGPMCNRMRCRWASGSIIRVAAPTPHGTLGALYSCATNVRPQVVSSSVPPAANRGRRPCTLWRSVCWKPHVGAPFVHPSSLTLQALQTSQRAMWRTHCIAALTGVRSRVTGRCRMLRIRWCST